MNKWTNRTKRDSHSKENEYLTYLDLILGIDLDTRGKIYFLLTQHHISLGSEIKKEMDSFAKSKKVKSETNGKMRDLKGHERY